MVTLGLSSLGSRSRAGTIGAAALAIWIAVEYAPDFLARAATAEETRASFDRFKSHTANELRSLVRPAEKVLFLGVGGPKNEYLSLYLCAIAGCRTFNASGDKNLDIARKRWSQTMQVAYGSKTSDGDRAAAITRLLHQGKLDALVIANFDMRWDSYGWNVKPAEAAEHAKALLVPYTDLEGLSISRGTYFSVVRKDGSVAPSTGTGRE
jgi:hypothetical protein